MEANVLPGDDVVRLYAGAPGSPAPALSIQGASEDAAATGDLDIIGNLSIIGEGMALSGADASALGDRAVHVLPGSRLSLSGLSFAWADAGAGQNGGGILNEASGSVQIGNSIIATNAYGSSYTEADCLGTIVSGGYNLIGTLADCSLAGDTDADPYGDEHPDRNSDGHGDRYSDMDPDAHKHPDTDRITVADLTG